MTNLQLSNLATLAIEHKATKEMGSDKVINDFDYILAWKVIF